MEQLSRRKSFADCAESEYYLPFVCRLCDVRSALVSDDGKPFLVEPAEAIRSGLAVIGKLYRQHDFTSDQWATDQSRGLLLERNQCLHAAQRSDDQWACSRCG